MPCKNYSKYSTLSNKWWLKLGQTTISGKHKCSKATDLTLVKYLICTLSLLRTSLNSMRMVLGFLIFHFCHILYMPLKLWTGWPGVETRQVWGSGIREFQHNWYINSWDNGQMKNEWKHKTKTCIRMCKYPFTVCFASCRQQPVLGSMITLFKLDQSEE